MGDRNDPIKFGPEWLRNLARENSAGNSASNSQSLQASGVTTSAGASGSSSGTTASSSNAATTNTATSTTNTTPKVQLAKLRYGREEMLALYDRTAEAPPELKYLEVLYQPRGKPPYALNNTFEEEMRENMRSGPPIGGVSSTERFGVGRGMGRGVNVSDGRGRPRVLFVRQQSSGRASSWHLVNPRVPGYGGGPEDDSSLTLRSWNNSNGGNMNSRNGSEQSERTPSKMFRSKRQGNSTNWRQPHLRDDGEEWRSSDSPRSRSNPDKWERDWGDRPIQDKQWNTNRRTWVAGDTQNDDNIPEWAIDGAESGAGTFDSSGAFHGYSNDDTNLPKSQESSYPLTRSHTHGSFARSKTAEEGSEEWWASEKAKKLSPKRFDASDIKFKKQSSTGIPEVSANATSSSKPSNKEETPTQEVPEKLDPPAAASEPPENHSSGHEDNGFNKKNSFKQKFTESKTFDALMRSDINLEEASDERGNFQSVMITPNNSLRQKHQNIVSPVNDDSNRQGRKPGVLLLTAENELGKQHQSQEDKIVEEIFDMTLEDKDHILSKLPRPSSNPMMNPSSSGMASGMVTVVNSMAQIPNAGMQLRIQSPTLSNQGLTMNTKTNLPNTGIQAAGMQTPGLQTVGITNSALNASLGLPLIPGSNTIGIPLQGVPPPVLPNPGNPGIGSNAMQASGAGISGFQPGSNMSGMSGANVANNSLFLGQNPNNAAQQIPSSNDMQLPNHVGQPNIYPMHGLQHTQTPFGSSIYSNIIQQSQAQATSTNQSLADQWYYEDPNKNIQGPFTSKDMYNWYRAGFFTPSLMVRRACDVHMRPLGSYGPVVPFAQMDMLSSFSLSGGFESRTQGPHESMLNSQPGLGLDVINPMSNVSDNTMDTLQFGTVGLVRNPPFGQQQMDSLWSQPSPSPDLMWMQQAMNTRNETRVNNLPMFFWDQQPSAITSNSLLPEEIAKEMKTEDQILAQLRASQNLSTQQNMPFINDQPAMTTSVSKTEDTVTSTSSATPNLEELHKLIQKDTITANATLISDEPPTDDPELQLKSENVTKIEQNDVDFNNIKLPQTPQVKTTSENKPAKPTKTETEKTSKNKETNNTKNKSKKAKEEKKEEPAYAKTERTAKEEENNKTEKKSEESSPAKSKKEDKPNKKALDKLTKEWLKDRGYTIVKVPEKNANKDSKKKAEEAKAAEEFERKRKEEEKLAAEEEKKKKQAETLKKQQQEQQQQQQRQAAESVMKKAPWSAVANQALLQATNKDNPTLAEIQRLEREKKLEQMKEQQQMMQIIAQQQVAALAREQEMQAGLGWAKKKGTNLNTPGQSLVEIQAEARKLATSAAQVIEEVQPAPSPQANHVPWSSSSSNGGGFWDTQPSQPVKAVEKPQDLPKIVEQNKTKKKITLALPMKKETTPAVEFEAWCTTVLTSWSAKIDVPTFVGFLKDIESPYEVKDYVKCYLGESKDSSDFARQFLERRSKLLRVGMVTPSDDLCSPAVAVNPRTISGSDYQEVKGKGKKTKKNKMLKVDARILGFSVTAAEDRINVGDIDTV